jgi:hypothetical protein
LQQCGRKAIYGICTPPAIYSPLSGYHSTAITNIITECGARFKGM